MVVLHLRRLHFLRLCIVILLLEAEVNGRREKDTAHCQQQRQKVKLTFSDASLLYSPSMGFLYISENGYVVLVGLSGP